MVLWENIVASTPEFYRHVKITIKKFPQISELSPKGEKEGRKLSRMAEE